MRILIVAVCMILPASIVIGVHSAAADPATQPVNQPTTQPLISNKLCPVTKDPVDPKIPTVEYKGKTIGFCCSDCVKAFKADPEKYMANLK